MKYILNYKKWIEATKSSEFIKNRFYLFGLILQKGIAYLTIPLILWQFGVHVYTNYVLLYAATQLLALLIGLGIPSALIVYWYDVDDKSAYLTTILSLLVCFQTLVLLGVFALLHYSWGGFKLSLLLPNEINQHLVIIAVYAIFYNFNNITIGLLRAQGQSKGYFYGVLLSSLTFMGFLLCAKQLNSSVIFLTSLFIFSLFLQSAYFICVSHTKPVFRLLPECQRFSKAILKYTGPIVLLTGLSLSTSTFDKWLVKGHFQDVIFKQYVLNFQFAYILNALSVVIGMYNLPIFCQLVKNDDVCKIKKNFIANYILVIVGSLLVGGGMSTYAHLTGVGLSIGFWVLCVSFIFVSLYTVNVAYFEALKSSKRLLAISMASLVIFWLLFTISIYINEITLVYYCYLFYGLCLFLLTAKFIYPHICLERQCDEN
ncbi:MAG: hypothetical protein DHS20C10_10440 [marine bacterium B5-7]|nr:MAG: hypothetical protein DHS20C10_10440 [marine bacterium B5-7]